jgi:hypothetical protein
VVGQRQQFDPRARRELDHAAGGKLTVGVQ